MSGSFLRSLRLPEPDVQLRVGGGTQAEQTARIMTRLESALLSHAPQRLVVFGDVNSTLASALVASKLGIPVDHVEAGLRSGDRTMPEEINRLVTDTLAERLFASEPSAVRNLLREGRAPKDIFLVGNVMIDSLIEVLPQARSRALWVDLGLRRGQYAVVTLHRPSNVDNHECLGRILAALSLVSQRIPVVFPIHPRTRRTLRRVPVPNDVKTSPPLGYPEFISLILGSRLVITDSGGVQEETTYLGVPCLTLRRNTERPITVRRGTNTLIGADPARLPSAVDRILGNFYKKGTVPALWDGRAAERIAAIIASA
jgi:UDP-N-acetylglucosamine 2-epimerase (non-hydrolysing)